MRLFLWNGLFQVFGVSLAATEGIGLVTVVEETEVVDLASLAFSFSFLSFSFLSRFFFLCSINSSAVISFLCFFFSFFFTSFGVASATISPSLFATESVLDGVSKFTTVGCPVDVACAPVSLAVSFLALFSFFFSFFSFFSFLSFFLSILGVLSIELALANRLN